MCCQPDGSRGSNTDFSFIYSGLFRGMTVLRKMNQGHFLTSLTRFTAACAPSTIPQFNFVIMLAGDKLFFR